jgi:hypothetical protein
MLPDVRYKRTLDRDMYVLKASRLLSRNEIAALQTTWQQIPGVALVEPDVMVQITAVPNDPEYPNQWHYFRHQQLLVAKRITVLMCLAHGIEAHMVLVL